MKKQKNILWNEVKSSEMYGLDFWGKPYFSVNPEGNIQVHCDEKKNYHMDLYEMIKELKGNHINLPVLVRFPDLILSQMQNIQKCFQKAIEENNYQGEYKGVFPIKVNQQSHVISDIVEGTKKYNFGLEAGSKPELLIGLSAIEDPKCLLICNGFKDEDYIEMALLSQKMGKNVILVVERKKELNLIIKLSKELKHDPKLGFRLKLNTQNSGLWSESSGNRSKFGLSYSEILEGIEDLKKENLLQSLCLIHFHIGSQIPSIRPIKTATRETSRIMSELYDLGCKIEYIDVGGGLGIDYDGTGKTRSSINYDVQEYANDIVFGIQSVCEEKKIPHPNIISESGRFIVAQSSVLVFEVMDRSDVDVKEELVVKDDFHEIIKNLNETYQNLEKESFNESFNDLMDLKKDLHQLFVYDVLSLSEAVMGEKIYWKAVAKLQSLVAGNEDYDDIDSSLKNQLADNYFCNFSIFQSLPDAWALSYHFPIMPIHRLKEYPTRKACLMDLTCDSDGKLSKFINYETWEVDSHLPVHDLKKDEPYLLGIFLIGAYQEILGDLHNLFGDTDAIHVRISKNGKYSIEHKVEGDTISDVLSYTEFYQDDLISKMHRIVENSVIQGKLSRQESGALLQKFKSSLSKHTYLK